MMVLEIDAYHCKVERSPDPIIEPITKIGGLPVFLKETTWPTCQTCGQEMDFLFQVSLQYPTRFSSRYQMAYVFMCPGSFDERGWLLCPTRDPWGGANTVILQYKSNDVFQPIKSPKYPDYSISYSQVIEPVIDKSDFQLEKALRCRVPEITKIGGSPAWIQNNETPLCGSCGKEMRFVAQVDAALDGPLSANPSRWADENKQFFEFGDAGIGYLFLCQNECESDGAAFFWQTT